MRSPLLRRESFRVLAPVAAAAVCWAGLVWGAKAEPEGRPPNLIVIMADDLGAKELSCYGNKHHQTPNLDRLARTGVQFATAYSTPICHPTRFEIMTGQYGCNNGVYHFPGRRGGPDPKGPADQIINHVTFAQLLKPKGYATALTGKWQLSGEVPTLVRETGFDEYCMWAYRHNLPEGVEHDGGWEGRKGQKTSRYWHPSIVRNAEYLPTEKDDYGPDVFTDFLIDFARRHKDGPFFIYYPMALTHAPYYSTPTSDPNEVEKFKHTQEKFKENVEYTDKLVGRIVDALEEMGLRENTILFFTGDNGTGGQGKAQPTELGARVPLIVNCPGRVKPLKLSDELVDLSDIMPTLADLAGAKLPKDRPIDGRSFAFLLRGEPGEVRDWIFAYLGDRRTLRTKRWLLEDNSPHHDGRLYDCGASRDGTGYQEVTDSTDPDVLAIKKEFEAILATKPAPLLPTDGPLNPGRPKRKPKKAARK
jgi:arylsulfatase A